MLAPICIWLDALDQLFEVHEPESQVVVDKLVFQILVARIELKLDSLYFLKLLFHNLALVCHCLKRFSAIGTGLLNLALEVLQVRLGLAGFFELALSCKVFFLHLSFHNLLLEPNIFLSKILQAALQPVETSLFLLMPKGEVLKAVLKSEFGAFELLLKLERFLFARHAQS